MVLRDRAGVSRRFRRRRGSVTLRARVPGCRTRALSSPASSSGLPGRLTACHPGSTEVTRAACVLPGSGGRCGCLGPAFFPPAAATTTSWQAPAAGPAGDRRRSASWAPRPARTPSSASTSPTAPSSPSSSTTRPSPASPRSSWSTPTRQGDPTQATAAGQEGDHQTRSSAWSARRSPASPRRPSRSSSEAGIPNISPVGDQRRRWPENGWKFCHRVLANDAVQGPGIADFIARTVSAKKVGRDRRPRASTARAWPTSCQARSRPTASRSP